jgi:hypothetical protein
MPTKKNKTEHLKKSVLDALEKSLGVVTSACKISGVSRTQFYQWCKDDLEFKSKVDSIEMVALDFAESKLFENIKEKKETSIIFFLKTKGKKRGYIEKQQIEHQGGMELNMTDEERDREIEALKKKLNGN